MDEKDKGEFLQDVINFIRKYTLRNRENMELKFDKKGHLIPYERINLRIEDFEEFFINNFNTKSTRKGIFQSYLKFINDFKEEITSDFTQWIDGSFVTQKTNPRDIDFVTLIEHEVYKEKRSEIDDKFRLSRANEIYNVDAYTIEIYPEGHGKHSISKIDLVYWDNWFSKTKKNWAKKTFSKGYIEIRFGDKDKG